MAYSCAASAPWRMHVRPQPHGACMCGLSPMAHACVASVPWYMHVWPQSHGTCMCGLSERVRRATGFRHALTCGNAGP
eukprot:359430-Chlamydomonas_euryale.AAC.1